MEAAAVFLTDTLKNKGIRPSYHRVKVLEYLHRQGGHPTAEQIYSALAPDIPSLSKVTIYNTLHTFVEAGLVRMVEIDEAQMRYDVTTGDHGHFLCLECGSITNFPVAAEALTVDALGGFQITHKDVHFKGLCPQCLDRSKK